MPSGSRTSRRPFVRGSSALRVEVRPDRVDPDAARLLVIGDLDLVGAPLLGECVEEQLLAGYRHLVLDLGPSSFCDARGLAALLKARDRVASCGGSLVIVGASELLRRAIAVTGLADELPVEADVVPLQRN